MQKVIVPFGQKTVVLSYGDFDDEVNVDDLTSIDYSNLYGEAVTVSALMNRIGILKSEAEANHSQKKLDCDIYEANLSRGYRRESNTTGGKFTIEDETGAPFMMKLTDKAVEAAVLLDLAYQNKRKAVINAKRDLDFIESIYWAVQSKDKKLSVLMKATSPEEFYNELIEGKVNGLTVNKPVDKWTDRKNTHNF